MSGVLALTAVCAVGVLSAAAFEHDPLFTKPDYVVYVPKQPYDREKNDPQSVSDRYNDHFHVLFDEGRTNHYAFWTQGSWDGAPDMHIVFSKSRDGGRSWSCPKTLSGIERLASSGLSASFQQPMLSKSGRLYCLWQQYLCRGNAPELLYGTYSDDGGETWSRAQPVPYPGRVARPGYLALADYWWCNWQRPLRLGRNGRHLVPSTGYGSEAGVEFWEFENLDDDPPVEKLRVSMFATGTNRLCRARLAETECPYVLESGKCKFEEGCLVRLPDGRLFVLMRTETGHPCWSVSEDQGRTWRDPKFLRFGDGGEAIPHPCSPCPIYDWKGPEAGSGFYVAFVHNAFDFSNRKKASFPRGAVYLLAGRFDPKAEQPIAFSAPRLFVHRPKASNSLYASLTVVHGEAVIWYPDAKYYLLGKRLGKEWFE